MKTRAGYWIGGGLIALAIVGATLWGVLAVKHLTDKVNDFTRVRAEDSAAVHLEARKYVVYYEDRDGDEHAPAITVAVADENGVDVPIRSYLSDLTYDFGGHAGSAQVTVTPPHEGEYRVSVSSDYGGEAEVGSGVAIGESLSRPLLRGIFGALAIGAVFGLSGIAILTTTIVRRHNARRPPPGPPPVFVDAPPFAQPAPHGQETPYGRETPHGQETPWGQAPPHAGPPPPPPYGQTPSPGPPPEDHEPPPPPLWGGRSD